MYKILSLFKFQNFTTSGDESRGDVVQLFSREQETLVTALIVNTKRK